MNTIKSSNRREFIKKSTMGGALTLSIPEIVSSVMGDKKTDKVGLQENDVVLFQGDSITDAGRNKEDQGYNTSNILGSGYAMLAAASLLYNHPSKNLKIYNRGISGNKVYQLAERWDADAMELKPNVLSILIGVNDYWHTLTGGYKGTIETYRTDFVKLLDRTLEKYPDLSLVIGEPFAVKGIKAVDDSWYPAFDEYRAAAKEIADQYKATFIPYQDVFDKAQKSAPGSYWTGDGVHPTLAGSQLMAEAWLKAVK